MEAIVHREQNVSMATRVRPAPKPQKRRHFVRQWRKFKNLTQEQLAERVGVTPGTISQLETGRINYTQPLLEKLADEFGCKPGDILNVDPNVDAAMWSIWEKLDLPDRNQVADIAATFHQRKTGTGG
jgi:transcriptional regulator with XRE-family HTH domain